MTPADLNTLARDIAEAAAKCVGREPSQAESATYPIGGREAAGITCAAGDWRLHATAVGPVGATAPDALNAAAVLALRDRVAAQREERARMLAADDAALRVIDETARIYDAATAEEAVDMACARFEVNAATRTANVRARLRDGKWPKTRREMEFADGGIADACDAILRRRAGTP